MHTHFSAKKEEEYIIPHFSINNKLISRHSLGIWNTFKRIIDELQRGHELLRDEVNQLKSHIGLVMETLQTLLRSEGNPPPIAAVEMVTPQYIADFTPDQRQSHASNTHYRVYGPPLGYPPQPLLPRPSYQ